MFPGQSLNIQAILFLFSKYQIITFNGNNYDIPMISAALTGLDCATLKRLSDSIIQGGVKHWHFYKQYNIPRIPNIDHIDLIEVAPGVRISLKMYAGRMHSRKMQDLPIDPSAQITPFQRLELSVYCGNDLDNTHDLLREVEERLLLREKVGKEYDIDLMSKSDAQMSEAIILSQLPFIPEKITIPHGFKFKYVAPSFIKFTSPQLQELLQLVQTVDYVVNDIDQIRANPDDDIIGPDGKKIKTGVKMPTELKRKIIKIGSMGYKIGIGGLHSQEGPQNFKTEIGKHTISDHDVTSYYPSLILLMGMFPRAIGQVFIEIYRKIYDMRLAAKKAGDKITADGLKIALNGAFGKLGSKYSKLFAPELLIRTTITGQLALLMLIEAMEAAGIRVVSANTDGIVLKTPVGFEWVRDQIIKDWEAITTLRTEATFYKAIYMRDVNNYLAIKHDGTHKGKGFLTESGITNNKHPAKEICNDAVIAYLKNGTPIEQTINNCNDIRKFLVIRQVKGGGEFARLGDVPPHATKEDLVKSIGMIAIGNRWNWPNTIDAPFTLGAAYNVAVQWYREKDAKKQYLGKAVRWYYTADPANYICYTANGNRVAGSEGAFPLMTLVDSMPGNVDRTHYIEDAYKMLETVGVDSLHLLAA